MPMTSERLVQHAQRHFLATARCARNALAPKLKLSVMQQKAEMVSDYPDDISKRIAHALQEPRPPIPPLPDTFDPDIEGEDARAFAVRALTIANELALNAATLTDLRALQQRALLILAYGDAAEVRLRIAVREARDEKRGG